MTRALYKELAIKMQLVTEVSNPTAADEMVPVWMEHVDLSEYLAAYADSIIGEVTTVMRSNGVFAKQRECIVGDVKRKLGLL